jgi:hypothetical protein
MATRCMMCVWANTHIRGKFMSGPGGIRFKPNKPAQGKELPNRSGGRETPPLMPRATKVTEEARQRTPASAKKGSAILLKGKAKVRPPQKPPARPTAPAPSLAPRRAESARRDALGEPPPQGNEEAKIPAPEFPPARPTMPPPPVRPTMPPPTLPPRRPETSKKAEQSETERLSNPYVDYSNLPPISPRIEGDPNIVTPKLTDPGTN